MWYAIIAEDHPNSLENRLSVRPEHLKRVEQLQAEGRLLVAGPHPMIDSEDPGAAGFSGSLIIADFDNLESATTWANEDAYVRAGVFASVTVKPFQTSFTQIITKLLTRQIRKTGKHHVRSNFT